MQTFLPYLSYYDCAKCLDRQRLGKQRVEVLQILKALSDGGAWSNHPITKAWEKDQWSLSIYGIYICLEWVKRGYKDSCMSKIASMIPEEPDINARKPQWLNDELCSQYRGLLLYKNREWYSQFGWEDEPIERIDYSLLL